MRFLELVTQQRGAVSALYCLTNQEEENVGVWRELFFFLRMNDQVSERLRFGWSLWACLFAHHRVEINVPDCSFPPGLGLSQLCSSTRQELALLVLLAGPAAAISCLALLWLLVNFCAHSLGDALYSSFLCHCLELELKVIWE